MPLPLSRLYDAETFKIFHEHYEIQCTWSNTNCLLDPKHQMKFIKLIIALDSISNKVERIKQAKKIPAMLSYIIVEFPECM